MTLLYRSSCADNGKGALDTPETLSVWGTDEGKQSHGWLQRRGEVGSRQGEVGLAESASSASPSSKAG
eukprot:6536875-Pyramimonas_sp.AAC.1